MITYQFNYAAFGEHVLNAEWMVQELRRRAEAGKSLAESIAPFYPDDPDGNHYRDAFEVTARKHGGVKHDRAEAVLRNTDKANVYVEYGNIKTPEHATLRKALDVMGA
jgi:hypothetical protein